MSEKLKVPLTVTKVQNHSIISNDYAKLEPYLKKLPEIDSAFSPLFQRFPVVEIYNTIDFAFSYANYSKISKDLIDNSIHWNQLLRGRFFQLAASFHNWKGIKQTSLSEVLSSLSEYESFRTIQGLCDLIYLQTFQGSPPTPREMQVILELQLSYVRLLKIETGDTTILSESND